MIETLIQNSPAIATVFFFTIFCYVIFVTFKKGTKKKFDQCSKIPFKDHD